MATASQETKKPASPKGRRRRRDILDAAEEILVAEGYAGFSMRKVGEQLGIRLSNVQYYFPTPNAVVDALFNRALSIAGAELEASGAVDFQRLVRMALDSQNSARSCRLFWELWALSAREADIAGTHNSFYSAYRDAIEQCIKALNPSLKPAARRRRAIIIMSLLEGVSLFRGSGRDLAGTGAALDRDILATAQSLVRQK